MQASEIRKNNLRMIDKLRYEIAKGKNIRDPKLAMLHANNALSSHKAWMVGDPTFKHMLQVFDDYQYNWTTQDDASKFFQCMSDAIDFDLKTILATDSEADVKE